ncbi:MAG: ester cyclase [Spirochaetota bacterium]
MNQLLIILITGSIAACSSTTVLKPNTGAPQIEMKSFVKEHWSETEKANAAIVVDFVNHIMNRHDFAYIRKKYGSNKYVQHNRNAPDGIEGVIAFVSGVSKDYPDFSYDVKQIIVDNDLVMFHSHATLKKSHRGDDSSGLNIKDTWRIKDGEIVEHWDAIQPMDFTMRLLVLMEGGSVKNQNGVYRSQKK